MLQIDLNKALRPGLHVHVQPTSDVGTVQSTSSATSLIITVVLFETTTNEMHLSVSFPTGGQEPCLSHVTCDFCNGAEEVGNPTCHSVKADFKNNAYQKQDHTKYVYVW